MLFETEGPGSAEGKSVPRPGGGSPFTSRATPPLRRLAAPPQHFPRRKAAVSNARMLQSLLSPPTGMQEAELPPLPGKEALAKAPGLGSVPRTARPWPEKTDNILTSRVSPHTQDPGCVSVSGSGKLSLGCSGGKFSKQTSESCNQQVQCHCPENPARMNHWLSCELQIIVICMQWTIPRHLALVACGRELQSIPPTPPPNNLSLPCEGLLPERVVLKSYVDTGRRVHGLNQSGPGLRTSAESAENAFGFLETWVERPSGQTASRGSESSRKDTSLSTVGVRPSRCVLGTWWARLELEERGESRREATSSGHVPFD